MHPWGREFREVDNGEQHGSEHVNWTFFFLKLKGLVENTEREALLMPPLWLLLTLPRRLFNLHGSSIENTVTHRHFRATQNSATM